MKLNDFKDEVYKCSGCGLCQSVCPVYKVLKKECAVSRGKFKLLNAIINKDIKFSKKTLEIMELCLHCQACTEFCPSGIDAQKILETTQNELLNCGIFNFSKFFAIQILTNKFYMKMLKLFLNILRKSKILEIASMFGCKKSQLLKELLKVKIKPIEVHSNIKKDIKALYFKGCINNYVNPSCENGVKKVLDNTSVEIIEADFSCCGLPLKSSGDFESFKNIAKINIDLVPDDIDYLLFDCASCKCTFLNYAEFLEDDYKEKALKIAQKCISIYELLEKIDYKPKSSWKTNNITIHFPCHIRGMKEKEIIENLISKIPKTNYLKSEEADSCCGAAGSFILTNSEISKEISKNKAQNIINSKAEIVLTTCPSCILGLKQGLIEKKSKVKTMQLIEFLAE
ncbi:MAG: (Fe-S)-binding protein [Candidatus Gastranaerophilales bacterium]|nr:(Fe-S)-binding protein [Candidatus Gastranaerophilales bacterium]